MCELFELTQSGLDECLKYYPQVRRLLEAAAARNSVKANACKQQDEMAREAEANESQQDAPAAAGLGLSSPAASAPTADIFRHGSPAPAEGRVLELGGRLMDLASSETTAPPLPSHRHRGPTSPARSASPDPSPSFQRRPLEAEAAAPAGAGLLLALAGESEIDAHS